MNTLRIHFTTINDPLALPLVDGLSAEYLARYGPNQEMSRFPAEDFMPPDGAFVLLLHDDLPVAGGAFRRYDDDTAEIKRMWTHERHRRRGMARRVIAELEAEAAQRGYRRIVLSTGPKQPEAVGLYLRTGYRLRPAHSDEEVAFSKDLRP